MEKRKQSVIAITITVVSCTALPIAGALYLPVWAMYWIGLFLGFQIMRRKDRDVRVNCCYALCLFIAVTFSSLLNIHSVIAARVLLGTWLIALVWAMKASIGLWIFKTINKVILKTQAIKGGRE